LRILLDTHVLLWALAAPSRLSLAARRSIERGDVYVSAASVWEVAIKSSLGKLLAKASDVLAAIEPAGFSLLPITGERSSGR
jgi:PIN domain nuclease of toxin-antitoxin system